MALTSKTISNNSTILSLYILFKVSHPLFTITYHYIRPQPNHSPRQTPPSTTMPSYQRQVGFAPTPAYSRLPRDDEVYVMKAFARHASHCSSCAHPYDVHRRGGTLCSKGHQRAIDVAQYLYNMSGQAYSLVDHEGNQRMQVEIPLGCEAVRDLLKAMERGLRLRRKAPVTSYDQTYYVPARHNSFADPSVRQEPSYSRKPRLETAEPPAWSIRQQRREKPYYAGRDSLYEHDLRERERKYKQQQPAYYGLSSRQPPPVPPKDPYWQRPAPSRASSYSSYSSID